MWHVRQPEKLHTPDFLVFRTDGASFEEWKPEEKLLELIVTYPGRYERDDRGTWHCHPVRNGEARGKNRFLFVLRVDRA